MPFHRLRGCGALFVSIVLAPATLVAQPRITFEPTTGVSTFAVREPVLRITPGTIVESRTFSRPGDYYSPEGGPWPGEVGPFFIEGATTADTLVVRVLRVRPNRETAVSAVGASLSGVTSDARLRLLNEPFPYKRYVWRLDLERMTGTLDLPDSASGRIELPLEPMLGRVAVAPAGEEAFGGLWPGSFGGNMDASDVREGTTVFLPIFHDGAYFYFGDGHARQGDGEIAGSGLETTMDVTLQFDLVKGQKIAWPRLEDDEYLMVAGSARPLVDAFRIAQVELIEWLAADYGFDRADAWQIVSQAGETRVANVVDPVFTIVAKFPKRFLPPRVER